jgi:two-component system, cell cycle response regulator
MAHILVIEDNLENLELMTYLLRAFGHSAATALDGELGLELARRERPDLIVCDVHLPRVDGYEVVRRLKTEMPRLAGVPVIAVTALAMVGDREKGLARGFDGYIAKPIDPENFVAQLEGFLAKEQHGSTPARRDELCAAAESVQAPRRAVILVVDDSPTNRELIYQTLAPSGYDVRQAHSVQTALLIAATTELDLILSDLHMPGEDGFNLIRRVKGDPRLARLPFVFITSSVWGDRDRSAALELGVTRFLLRPIEPQTLIEEIGACLCGDRGG